MSIPAAWRSLPLLMSLGLTLCTSPFPLSSNMTKKRRLGRMWLGEMMTLQNDGIILAMMPSFWCHHFDAIILTPSFWCHHFDEWWHHFDGIILMRPPRRLGAMGALLWLRGFILPVFFIGFIRFLDIGRRYVRDNENPNVFSMILEVLFSFWL